MKRAIVFLIAILTGLQIQAQTIFVQQGRNGNGSSWQNAMGDLQQALKTARPGQQIWVAAGTYYPTKKNDRNASFEVHNGIQLFGGFSGTETQLNQRDFNRNRTVLSGAIGAAGEDDNSYSVLYTAGVSSSTVIDGFIITDGNANATANAGDKRSSGGGFFNNASSGEFGPTLNNCTFINNKAYYGAGIYNSGVQGICSASIQNCQFINNVAKLDGGAIHNDGRNGKCNIIISFCHFENNEATYGAGILNTAENGEANPIIENCLFLENVAHVRGSGVYNHRGQNGLSNPVIRGCRFEGNQDSVGSAVSSTVNNAAPTTTNGAKRSIKIRSTY